MSSYPNGRPTTRILLPLDPSKLNPGLANLVAHYKGDGNYNDASGNDYHLTKNGGVGFGDGVGGKQAILFGGAGELLLANAAHNANFALLGDYTFIALIYTFGSSLFCLASYDSPTDGSSDDNSLWEVFRGPHNSSTFDGGLYGGWETGTQSTLQWYGTRIMVPSRDFGVIAWQRKTVGGNIETQGWCNARPGFAAAQTTAVANAPTGGANSKFRLGSNGKSALRAWALMQDVMIFDTAIPLANIEAECYRVGVR